MIQNCRNPLQFMGNATWCLITSRQIGVLLGIAVTAVRRGLLVRRGREGRAYFKLEGREGRTEDGKGGEGNPPPQKK